MKEKKISKLNQILDSNEIIRNLSFSKVSDYDRNGAISLIRNNVKETNALKIGSLVDDLVFETKEHFDKTYYLFDGDKPTETLGKLCDIIVKNYTKIPTKEQILQIIQHNEFWKGIKRIELITAKFDNNEFWGYLKCIFETFDKVIVTTKELNEAKDLAHILKTHKYSKEIINTELESYNQFKFEFIYLNFNFRGIIDKIIIDHKKKKVRFIDLKTGADSALEFENSFIKWRYYFQGTIYTLAFKTICEVLDIKGYSLEDFEFLYISKKEKIPVLFRMSKNWLKAGVDGFKIGKYKYKGLNELCRNIEWCVKNDEYEIPEEIVKNNGKTYLRDNFIELNE